MFAHQEKYLFFSYCKRHWKMSQLRRLSLLSLSQFNIIIALKDLKAKKNIDIYSYIFSSYTHVYICMHFLRFKIFPSDTFILFLHYNIPIELAFGLLCFLGNAVIWNISDWWIFYKPLTWTCRYSLPIVIKQKWRWFMIEQVINQRLASKTPWVAKYLNGSFNTQDAQAWYRSSLLSHGHRSLSKAHTHTRARTASDFN